MHKKIGFQMTFTTKVTIRWILLMHTISVLFNISLLIYKDNEPDEFLLFRIEQIGENITFLLNMMVLLAYFYFMFKLRQV